MRWTLRLGTRLAALLAPIGTALAWGPCTHALVNQRALALLPTGGATAWLTERRAADAFVRAGPCADLTFRIAAGGKADPALNALLHSEAFAAHLLHVATARGVEARAAALGMLGHLVGDRTGNVPDAPTARDLFGFPRDRDPWGRPVTDPNRSAAVELFPVTAGLNKILIDALARPWLEGRRAAPSIDARFLADALASFRGPLALEPPLAPGKPARERVEKELRGFQTSALALRTLGVRIRGNHGLRVDLEALYGIRGDTIPGIETSARAVAAAIETAEGGAGPSSVAPTGPLPDDEALPQALQAAGAATTAEPDPPPGDVAGLRRKLLMRFFSRLVLPGARWPELRNTVRELVPALSAAPPPRAPDSHRGPGFADLTGGP